MIIYRPHRGGSVFEALAEAKEFNSIEEMKEYIVSKWDGYFSEEDIVLGNDVINDSRIGWEDARHVCVNKIGNEDYIEKYGSPQCIGWCATIYNK
jgi:hypothetical protein